MSKPLALCLVISIILNVILGLYVYRSLDEVHSVQSFSEAEQKYPLLSKRILQEYPQDLLLNFLELRNSLRSQLNPYGRSFGLYFEYLPTGTSISINSNEEFYAASLFKVPVVMAYYHALDRTNTKSDQTLTLRSSQLDKAFGDLWKKGEGHQLKASEAIKLSLTESDNTAVKALIPTIESEDFDAVYEALDLELHADQKGASVSARTYSSILKALYFSSVLEKDRSQEILDLLTKTKFSDKLAAGVPHDVLVAHKIGNFKDVDGKEGFRDCGIVYVPKRPYIVCMFSVGDEQIARERMQQASRTIYDFVAKHM